MATSDAEILHLQIGKMLRMCRVCAGVMTRRSDSRPCGDTGAHYNTMPVMSLV